MYLTNLSIHGFKSFAKKAELEFPATVTAIVGPNGSGKSNVAEALRFVLGEQSVKSLRGKRGEDLIWGGSDGLSRANRASVSITLQNEQRVLPLDSDTVTVERIVHRDGQNEYKLNQQTVRLKDVHELLAAGNIGPSGHHIISQGEADRILSATSLERRAMLEDALGLKVYQYKKNDAERKLSKTEQNIAEVTSLRKELAPHLSYLKRELDKRAEAKALRIELHDAYAEYLKREDSYLAHQYDSVQEKKRTTEEALATAADAIARLEADQVPTETKQTESPELAKLRQELTTLREERETVATKFNQISGRHAALREQVDALQQEPEAAMVPLPDVTEVVDEAANTLEATATETALDAVVGQCQRVAKTLRSFVSDRTETPGVDREAELTTQVDALMAEQQTIEEKLTKLKTAEQTKQREYEAAVSAREQAQAEAQNATRELYEQKTQHAELTATLRQLQHELELIKRERQSFKDELQEAVALLGRGAAQYFKQPLYDADGNEVSAQAMQDESRETQRERRRALEKLKVRLETIGDGAGEEVEKEYQETKERDDFLAGELEDLSASVETLQALISDLREQIDGQFQTGFQKIQSEFQNFFTLMFGGGAATLTLVVPDTPADDEAAEATKVAPRGIDLSVQLPNKRIQGLAMLSGGERALTSIALIFAMSQLHPPLFIVLDETDAALDEANSRRYGDLIEALAKRSQLILITHNRETMSRAGVLYGVTMGGDGVSKLLSVQLDEAVANAKS